MYAVLQRLLFWGISLDMLDVVLPILGGDFNTVEQVAIPPLSFTMFSIQSIWLATLVKMPGADWEKMFWRDFQKFHSSPHYIDFPSASYWQHQLERAFLQNQQLSVAPHCPPIKPYKSYECPRTSEYIPHRWLSVCLWRKVKIVHPCHHLNIVIDTYHSLLGRPYTFQIVRWCLITYFLWSFLNKSFS